MDTYFVVSSTDRPTLTESLVTTRRGTLPDQRQPPVTHFLLPFPFSVTVSLVGLLLLLLWSVDYPPSPGQPASRGGGGRTYVLSCLVGRSVGSRCENVTFSFPGSVHRWRRRRLWFAVTNLYEVYCQSSPFRGL